MVNCDAHPTMLLTDKELANYSERRLDLLIVILIVIEKIFILYATIF